MSLLVWPMVEPRADSGRSEGGEGFMVFALELFNVATVDLRCEEEI